MIPLERLIGALQPTAVKWRPHKDQLLLENEGAVLMVRAE